MSYNRFDSKDIERYTKKLIGHTFREILKYNIEKEIFDTETQISEEIQEYGSKSRKGGLGNLIEEKFFGYKANSNSEADFKEAGLELKVTPYEKNTKGFTAGERLVLSMIPYDKEVESDIFKSHLWEKCSLILLIFYFRDKSIKMNLDYKIDYVNLFKFPEKDLKIIISDYKIIIDKIKDGKAHELSESDTMYLGACTKGATAKSSLVPQYYNKQVKAKKRAFSLKQSYMKFVLNEYIIGESLSENIMGDSEKSFEEILYEKISKYVGKTDREISGILNFNYDKNKSFWIYLVYKMLGVKSNRAEEFEKSNIVVKAVRIEENGTIKESSSLPNLTFNEVIENNFENSKLFDYFNETKFYFVVFKKVNNQYVLKGSKLWNMPFSDYSIINDEYEEIRKVLIQGIDFEFKQHSNGLVIKNNLPKKNKEGIIHIRPHAQKSFYLIKGIKYGNGNIKDSDILPNGDRMVKQSFWINNKYILKQIKDLL
ncbi:restriction endonuclease [Streptobacillus felis]|uniref:Restriction endonuclease n=1 Tax=Streptobacillus felis TaxID=1384509 RepID=A0A7Z0PGH7_9FUSO|nr:Sau3AI family type II restriction endonuclease [Streptobacillus felis]NYV27625.1 restriction endonuclease [Streptobacillus felis]